MLVDFSLFPHQIGMTVTDHDHDLVQGPMIVITTGGDPAAGAGREDDTERAEPRNKLHDCVCCLYSCVAFEVVCYLVLFVCSH